MKLNMNTAESLYVMYRDFILFMFIHTHMYACGLGICLIVLCVPCTDVGDETARNLGEISLQLETSIHPGSQELEITVHGGCTRSVLITV